MDTIVNIFETNRMRIEFRLVEGDEYEIRWTDGPRRGHDFVPTYEQALREARESLAEEVRPTDIRIGDAFYSSREDEGFVRAVCPFGECEHDRRPDSVHVKMAGDDAAQFFIALIPNEPVHVFPREAKHAVARDWTITF